MIKKLLYTWLSREVLPSAHLTLFDTNQLLKTAKPADIWLIEGRSRLSRIIGVITRSPWTHAALYLGNPQEFLPDLPDEPVLIECLMEKGVVITPVSAYQNEHIRVCRPKGLMPADAKKVLHYTIERLGKSYDTLQIFDLARFLYPWPILPRRWHSSLFNYRAGDMVKLTCSCLLADAFESVGFPILPDAYQDNQGGYQFVLRNPKLFTPRDFDYSPFL